MFDSIGTLHASLLFSVLRSQHVSHIHAVSLLASNRPGLSTRGNDFRLEPGCYAIRCRISLSSWLPVSSFWSDSIIHNDCARKQLEANCFLVKFGDFFSKPLNKKNVTLYMAEVFVRFFIYYGRKICESLHVYGREKKWVHGPNYFLLKCNFLYGLRCTTYLLLVCVFSVQYESCFAVTTALMESNFVNFILLLLTN